MVKIWPFHDLPHVAVITDKHIIEDGMPILHVSHDSDDGSWQFLTGTSVSEYDARVVALREMVQHDPTICEIADLPLGWIAWREDRRSTWQRLAK